MWPPRIAPTESAQASRSRLLAAVGAEVCERREQSLHGWVWRHYGQGLEPPGTGQVTTGYRADGQTQGDDSAELALLGPCPWHGTWQRFGIDDPSEPCREGDPPGVDGQGLNDLQSRGLSILNLLDAPTTAGQLWITGAAGMGKTTALLELAAELVQRAERDEQAPIPVLFHGLSVGQGTEVDGLAWLVDALQHKYGVTPKLGYRWLMDGTLLPLLDGWDELSSEEQSVLGPWIQAWWEQGHPMVIAGGEGAKANLRPKLILTLHPLTDDHLAAYLSALGLTDWWLALQTQPATLALVRTPLLLMLAILTRPTQEADPPWPSSPEALLDRFIAQQIQSIQKKLAPSPTPSPDRWLTWLAQPHPHHGGDIFWLEAMQPTLLKGKSQQRRYQLLAGLLFGLAGGMIFGLFAGPGSGLLAFAVISLMFWLVRRDAPINTETDLCPDFPTFLRFIAVRQINFILLITAATGLGMALTSSSWIGLGMGIIIGLVVGLLVRAIILIPSGLLGGIIYGLSRVLDRDVAVRQRPNHGIQVRLEYSLGLTALFLWGLILLKVLGLGIVPQVAPTLTAPSQTFLHIASLILALVLWANIFSSGLACAQHAALRLVLYWGGAIPWNLAQALRLGCEAHLLQRVGGHYRFIHPQVRDWLAQGSILRKSPN